MTNFGRPTFPSEAGVPGVPWWTDDLRDPAFFREFPPSLWEDLALAHIEEHIRIETGAVATYEELGKAEDPQIKYLAAMIVSDEVRHHELLKEIATSLRSRVAAKADQSDIARKPMSDERRGELAELAKGLLKLEEDDADKLKALRRNLNKAPEDTVWPLMVEIMELDTDKHIRILKAVERYLSKEKW